MTMSSVGEERAQIRALRDAHNAAIAARDIDAIVRLAIDDFVMILGGSGKVLHSPADYRAAAVAAFGGAHPMRFVRTPDRIDVGTDDGFAVAAESGRWVGTRADDTALRLTGRYLVGWTKRGGDWRIASETYVQVTVTGEGG